jgi:hypothetical protein
VFPNNFPFSIFSVGKTSFMCTTILLADYLIALLGLGCSSYPQVVKCS